MGCWPRSRACGGGQPSPSRVPSRSGRGWRGRRYTAAGTDLPPERGDSEAGVRTERQRGHGGGDVGPSGRPDPQRHALIHLPMETSRGRRRVRRAHAEREPPSACAPEAAVSLRSTITAAMRSSPSLARRSLHTLSTSPRALTHPLVQWTLPTRSDPRRPTVLDAGRTALDLLLLRSALAELPLGSVYSTC